MLNKCLNCGRRSLFSRKDAAGTFCSRECQSYYAYPTFCPSCIAATTDQSSGGTFTFNFIGTAFVGGYSRCPVCGSVVQILFGWLILPLVPLGRYRVKYITPDRFYSRALKKT